MRFDPEPGHLKAETLTTRPPHLVIFINLADDRVQRNRDYAGHLRSTISIRKYFADTFVTKNIFRFI